MTEPEVRHLVGFARGGRLGTFEAKESAFSEIAKRRATRGITTLGDHDSAPSAPGGPKKIKRGSFAHLRTIVCDVRATPW